jgi:hypothetical protein
VTAVQIVSRLLNGVVWKSRCKRCYDLARGQIGRVEVPNEYVQELWCICIANSFICDCALVHHLCQAPALTLILHLSARFPTHRATQYNNGPEWKQSITHISRRYAASKDYLWGVRSSQSASRPKFSQSTTLFRLDRHYLVPSLLSGPRK